MNPSERRERLVEWMRVSMPNPKTASEIVYLVNVYDPLGPKTAAQVCRADLRQLEREGRVRRHRGPDPEGRPHTWEVVR